MKGNVESNANYKKIEYTKPVVIAASKEGGNFSAGCQTRTGVMCLTCRCS